MLCKKAPCFAVFDEDDDGGSVAGTPEEDFSTFHNVTGEFVYGVARNERGLFFFSFLRNSTLDSFSFEFNKCCIFEHVDVLCAKGIALYKRKSLKETNSCNCFTIYPFLPFVRRTKI